MPGVTRGARPLRRGALLGAAAVALTALAALALAPPTGARAAGTDWLGLRTLNIAHQGGEDEAPSNTMYAYARAMELGADMLELDIHTTADGAIVVLHDATVDRTTNGSGRVYDMTLAEVQALDAGHNLVPGEGTRSGGPESDYPFRGVRTGERRPPPGHRPRDFRIPTLEEVMDAYPRVPINIEIKGTADTDLGSFLRNAERLAAFLNRLGRSEGIIVASFNDLALQHFHQLAPQIDLAPAVAGVAGYKLAGLPPPAGTVAFQVPIDFQGIGVTDREFVARAHRDGYAVHVWTINDEPTMRTLIDWGVDGIMTAEPTRLERVLCQDRVERPDRPGTFDGRHCSRRVSIACSVRAVRAARAGGGSRLRLTLRRRDEFSGRCAGQVAVRVAGRPARRLDRFSFGMTPPSEGGPSTRRLTVKLPRRLRGASRRGARLRLAVRPYGAFVERSRTRVR